jgi:hypothetical protein
MAAENLLASFFYFISSIAQMGNPPHTRGELRTQGSFKFETRRSKFEASPKFETRMREADEDECVLFEFLRFEFVSDFEFRASI